MWCFGSMRMFLDRRAEFDDWKLSQDIVWEKATGGSTVTTDRFARIHEHATHWYRGDWGSVYHQNTQVPYYGPKVAPPGERCRPRIRGAVGAWSGGRRHRWQSTSSTPGSLHRTGAINETQKPSVLAP